MNKRCKVILMLGLVSVCAPIVAKSLSSFEERELRKEMDKSDISVDRLKVMQQEVRSKFAGQRATAVIQDIKRRIEEREAEEETSALGTKIATGRVSAQERQKALEAERVAAAERGKKKKPAERSEKKEVGKEELAKAIADLQAKKVELEGRIIAGRDAFSVIYLPMLALNGRIMEQIVKDLPEQERPLFLNPLGEKITVALRIYDVPLKISSSLEELFSSIDDGDFKSVETVQQADKELSEMLPKLETSVLEIKKVEDAIKEIEQQVKTKVEAIKKEPSAAKYTEDQLITFIDANNRHISKLVDAIQTLRTNVSRKQTDKGELKKQALATLDTVLRGEVERIEGEYIQARAVIQGLIQQKKQQGMDDAVKVLEEKIARMTALKDRAQAVSNKFFADVA